MQLAPVPLSHQRCAGVHGTDAHVQSYDVALGVEAVAIAVAGRVEQVLDPEDIIQGWTE